MGFMLLSNSLLPKVKKTGSLPLSPPFFTLVNNFQQTRRVAMTTAIITGASTVAALLCARWFLRTWGAMQRTAQITGVSPFTYYYRGGFEVKMNKREAAMILGVREFARSEQIKSAHRRIMIANHPDRGGSPYLAMKINEAKAVLEDVK